MAMFSKRGATAAAVTSVAAGMAAAVAMAVPPPPSSSFSGNTSQTRAPNHTVTLQTDANGHVSQMTIDWRANCKKKGIYWTATTQLNGGTAGLPQNGDVFKDAGSYTGNAGNGIKGKVTIKMQGQFSDNDNASGTWTAKVTVRKKGKKIDFCKTPAVTWSAVR